jgi:Arc/MetJ-type ribon-helix-helix transcriptional regulator
MSGIPEWVSERVRRGDFASEAEVLEAARRALEAVEDIDPAALRSEVLSIRHEGADGLRADLQRRLDELDRGEGIPASIVEIVLWERRLGTDEQEMLARLRAGAAKVAAVDDARPDDVQEPARIIARLLREHVTHWLVPREFAEAVMERVRTGRYKSVEHVLYASVAGLEWIEADPRGAKARLREMLAGIDELLERGSVATVVEATGLVRRRTTLGELLTHGFDGSADRR